MVVVLFKRVKFFKIFKMLFKKISILNLLFLRLFFSRNLLDVVRKVRDCCVRWYENVKNWLKLKEVGLFLVNKLVNL